MNGQTDEHFTGFLEDFGPAFARRDVPAATLGRWSGSLPNQLLTYWKDHGWCGYAQGLLWIVDPDAYQPAAEAWLDGSRYAHHDNYHLFAIGAFGKLHFWGERTGCSLIVMAADAIALPSADFVGDKDRTVRAWFGSVTPPAHDLSDTDGKPLFARALKKLGRLNPGEMYGFVPALALGGPARLENLRKVKAVEHLVMLSQLTELRESRLLL